MGGDDANEAIGVEEGGISGGRKCDIGEKCALSFTFAKIFGDFPGALVRSHCRASIEATIDAFDGP